MERGGRCRGLGLIGLRKRPPLKDAMHCLWRIVCNSCPIVRTFGDPLRNFTLAAKLRDQQVGIVRPDQMNADWEREASDRGHYDRRPASSLSEFLKMLELRGQTWCIVEIRTSGGLSLPPHDGVWFYGALKGSVRIAGVSEGLLELTPGDVRMILSGSAHALRTAPDSPTVPLDFLRADRNVDTPPVFTIGKGPLVAQILCGRLNVNWPAGLRRAAMPPSVLIGDDSWGRDIAVTRAQTLQIFAGGAGATALLTQLAALMLSLALRSHPQCALLFRLSATDDPIAHALQLVSADPAANWSVDLLAQKVGMSRSSFASHFSAQVGRTPMELITERRMQLASCLLQQTDLKLTEISAKAGYHSESAFSRRFRQYFRISPGQMRKNFRVKRKNAKRELGDFHSLVSPTYSF